MLGVAADHGVVLELAEVAGEGDVLGAREFLLAEEQHLVLQQQRADLGRQAGVARGFGQRHVAQLGADGAGHGVDLEAARVHGGGPVREAWLDRGTHVSCLLCRSGGAAVRR
ncbi:hypothetical protein D9M69_659320 [compost metagenome]